MDSKYSKTGEHSTRDHFQGPHLNSKTGGDGKKKKKKKKNNENTINPGVFLPE